MAEEAASKAVWITTKSDIVIPQRLESHFANALNIPASLERTYCPLTWLIWVLVL